MARMALVGLACVGFALYCVYDGFVGYPQQRVRALKYIDFNQNGGANWKQEWKVFADERGWPPDDPGEPKGEGDFITQHVMAIATGLIALVFLALALRNRGRWIEGDETGLSTSWGRRCAFEDIFELNKKKWRNKGIAVVRYEQNGKKRRIVLDDCKYDIEGTEYLLREVESRLSDEQIVGGPAELPPEEQGEEQQAEDSQETSDVDEPQEQSQATKD